VSDVAELYFDMSHEEWSNNVKESDKETKWKNKILDWNSAASFSLNRNLKVAPIKNEEHKVN
jgi:hypothetical protein